MILYIKSTVNKHTNTNTKDLVFPTSLSRCSFMTDTHFKNIPYFREMFTTKVYTEFLIDTICVFSYVPERLVIKVSQSFPILN